jgi:hypothetical protein
MKPSKIPNLAPKAFEEKQELNKRHSENLLEAATSQEMMQLF